MSRKLEGDSRRQTAENRESVKKNSLQILLEIERKCQLRWERERVFEIDAPQEGETAEYFSHENKYMVTIPCPITNGRLHLGHAFTISKAEFAVGYERLKGKRCLFPFGFHCTGMPIEVCADKLKNELDQFGYPPVLPGETEKEEEEAVQESPDPSDPTKKTKSKVAAKTGNMTYQWDIMRSLGLSDPDIKRFVDPQHWLEYFPPLAKEDLKTLGLRVDWRRSFITTDANPYYNSFVRWQFTKLKERNKIKFGKRYSIFSPRDRKPSMDHNKAKGEAGGPQEYTLVKMKVVEPFPEKLSPLVGKPVFLVAATLHPETMYGQTNCWLNPDINYIAFQVRTGEVYVSTSRAALNMAYQDFTPEFGKTQVLLHLRGEDLMGVALKAPLTSYEVIYTLPMLTIKEDKGTGVMISVPSEVSNDYSALIDIQEDKVPIIDIPGIACDKFKVLTVGPHSGKKVQEAKRLIQGEMVASGEALLYQEPERTVTTRSGDQCVVALTDQWYLDYGESSWNESVRNVLKEVKMGIEAQKRIKESLDRFHQNSCSKILSSATWDPQFMIESLSDSTIYMAYYTVAYLLQGCVVNGSTPGPLGILPEQMTVPVWDYVFYGGDLPQTDISPDALRKLRREFSYWYPVDLLISGKDLVQNRLTYFLYNHQAIWPHPARGEVGGEGEVCRWPSAIRTNGHLLLKSDGNPKKISNSTGNFVTIQKSIDQFSADGTRLALANAGDGECEDPKYEPDTTTCAGLVKLLKGVKEMLECRDKLRCDPPHNYTYHDRIFDNRMNHLIQLTDHSYQATMYREALKTGFYNLQAARDSYRDLTAPSGGMNWNLVRRFIEVQALLLCPICPHISEHIWGLLGNPGSIMAARWPVAEEVNETLLREADYLLAVSHEFRVRLKKMMDLRGKKAKASSSEVHQPEYCVVYVAQEYPPWQRQALVRLTELYDKGKKCLPENKVVLETLKKEELLKKHMKKLMPFVENVRQSLSGKGAEALALDDLILPFNERSTLLECLNYLTQSLNLKEMWVVNAAEATDVKIREECQPGKPIPVFSETAYKPSVQVKVCVWVPKLIDIPVYDEDTSSKVADRVFRASGVPGNKLHHLKDSISSGSGQAMIGPNSLFSIEEGTLFLTDPENGATHVAVGSHLQYLADQ